MAESHSDRSSLSSVTDNESVYSSNDSLSSEESDTDSFPSGTEVLPYQFEPEPSPEPTADDPHAGIVTRSEDDPPGRIGNTNW